MNGWNTRLSNKFKKDADADMKRRKRLLAAGLAVLTLTGCGLLPEEEVFPASPVVRSYEMKETAQTTVKRGDMYLYKTVSCRYKPARKESYSFGLGGEYFEGVYISEGELVEEGRLLMELAQSELADDIFFQQYSIQELELKKQHLEELREIEVKKVDIWESEEDEDYLEDRAAVEEKYRSLIQTIDDSLYIANMKLTEMQEELRARKMYAAISGTVTYVKDMKEGKRSVEGESLVTISDMESTAFTVTGEDAKYFSVGDEVTIIQSKKECPAIVVDGTALGLESGEGQEEPQEKEKTAYIKLIDPDPSLEEGDSGKIEVLLDSRKNVLYVNEKAVKRSGSRCFVYVLNEDGLKVMHDITVGLICDGMAEVTSGLNEGDSVVLE